MAVLTAVFAALGPSARTLAERPRVVIPELANGQFAFVGDPRSNQSFPSELLFVRDPDGTLRAWWMPVSRGRVTLPDLHWWRPLARCADFGPDFARGEYRCRDAEVPDWIRNSLRWTLDGKSIPGKPMHHDDMPRVLGTAEGRHFRVDGIDWGK
ncbi:MAG: hypothetical protein KDH15_09230 [Rhodocyclaceae bacterium]|nr:hypothetical protein [Rhodocyclaceae bacterium]